MPDKTVAGTTEDPTIQFTELTLGKKTYKLCYDFASIAIAEARTGLALLMGVDWRIIGVMQTRAMLYASALKAHPKVTLDEFTPYIKPRFIVRITEALATTWMDSTPDKDDPENPPKPEPETAS
jgi:hypothetical protein